MSQSKLLTFLSPADKQHYSTRANLFLLTESQTLDLIREANVALLRNKNYKDVRKGIIPAQWCREEGVNNGDFWISGRCVQIEQV